jgi:hypothetical protein
LSTASPSITTSSSPTRSDPFAGAQITSAFASDELGGSPRASNGASEAGEVGRLARQPCACSGVSTEAGCTLERMAATPRPRTIATMHASSMSEAGALRIALAVTLTAAAALMIGALASVAAGIAVTVLALIAGFAFELRHTQF